MARVENNKAKMKTATKKNNQPTKPLQGRAGLRAAEELKLGKFAECTPLELPQKQIRREWQIAGAVVCMIGAIVGVYCLLVSQPLNYIFNPSPMSFMAHVASVNFYWNLATIALIIVAVSLLIASVMLFAKRRVPVWVWYLLTVGVLVGVVSLSFHKFELYEQRLCYQNYPNILEAGYSCPSVVGELSWIVVCDIVIWTVGIAILLVMHWMTRTRNRTHCKKARK